MSRYEIFVELSLLYEAFNVTFVPSKASKAFFNSIFSNSFEGKVSIWVKLSFPSLRI